MKFPRLTTINVLNAVGVVAAIYIFVLLGQTVKRNYDLSKQIDTLSAQIAQLQDQKDELAFSIQYYKTDSFRQREARAKLGFQAPGESVISLPQSTAAPVPTPSAIKVFKTKSNFRQWIDFFTGASS